MPARVQEVQLTDCHGRLGYSFCIWDESGTVGFATSEEAAQAAEQVKAIVARALLVISPH
jgi:hypothetical protein